jgi:hypothetical protein
LEHGPANAFAHGGAANWLRVGKNIFCKFALKNKNLFKKLKN